MTAAALAIEAVVNRVAPGPAFTLRAVRLAASIGGGMAALAVTAKVLRIDEFADASRTVFGRVQKLRGH
jgi:hypothetical protein